MAGVYAALEEALCRAGDATIIEWAGRALHGGDVIAGAEAAAGVLAASGVGAGDRVLVQVEKSLEAVFLYLAVLRQGAVFVPLNTGYRTKEFAYFLDDASPGLVICDPSAADEYAPMVHGAGAQLLTLDANGEGTFSDQASGIKATVDAALVEDHALAAMIYTSGTTGRSKGAMLSQANLLSNALALGRIWDMSRSDVLVHALPLFHIHGLFISLNTALLAGTCIRLLPRFDITLVLDALPGATVFMGVPTYYVRLLGEARFEREATKGLRLCISGSAPLLLETFDAFEERTGRALLERYGMSECGVIASNLPGAGIRRGAVGLPLPGVDMRIAGDDGSALPANTIGSVEVRGPGVFCGYWRMPEKTRAEFRPDGFFITGDLGRVDGEGYLHLVGRAKDMVISGGLNVYPSEVEAAIDALAGVDESAVIGVPHADFGEAVVAVVRLQPGERGDAEAVIRALKGELAAFKVPKAVVFTDDLPRNTMGKVEKAALRNAHAALFASVAA
ncbi:AMP-binding protein [Sphingosinicella soli]|uniref:Malonyl-CoA/methylmalonyl-CoA synthetase n=1 Tax=Sphingosinicella soli TaxID=333708 RepID=A0A7W7B593_9SPHN|nr:AMP-binding protein [Sphingosinicella soli]MBB4633360.1 malonyl-CoA/methylmalonyl-CoA synthetase [Sphingosinicella soli]